MSAHTLLMYKQTTLQFINTQSVYIFRLFNKTNHIIKFRSHGSQNLFDYCNISFILTIGFHLICNYKCTSKIFIDRLSYLHVKNFKFLSKCLQLCTLDPSCSLILLLHRIPYVLCCILIKDCF
ncbi:hypothetical protein ACOSP7_010793 [Xanthoceras sorbifolium]